MHQHQEILIPFQEGIDAQASTVEVTYKKTLRWLASLNISSLQTSRLMFAGIGASYAVLATPVYRLREEGHHAFRTHGDDMPIGSPLLADWYIGVSQSGRSPEVVQAVQHQRDPYYRLSIVNQPDSPLERLCKTSYCFDGLIDSGMSSVVVAATTVVLGMLSDLVVGSINMPAWDGLAQQLRELQPRAQPIVSRFASQLRNVGCVDFTARASSLSAAEQGALLLREGPKVPAMASSTRNYLHGMTDSVGNTAHVIIGGEREVLLAKQLRAFHVPILLVTDFKGEYPTGVDVIYIPSMPACPRSLLEILIMEILAVELASIRGTDINAGIMARIDTKMTD